MVNIVKIKCQGSPPHRVHNHLLPRGQDPQSVHLYPMGVPHHLTYPREVYAPPKGDSTPTDSICFSKYQIRSVAQSCPTLCDPMNHSTPGLPVHHQLPEFTQTHIHRVSDAIQPSHPLASPSPAPNPSQHQCLFQ